MISAQKKWPREVLLAYLAGLLDGEGYIGAKRRMPTDANRMVSPKYSVAVSIAMTDEAPVRLMAWFCNAEDCPKWRKRGEKLKPILQFDLENSSAAALLREVLPYLVAKRERAEFALHLQGLREESRNHRGKVSSTRVFKSGVNAGATYRTLALNDDFVARCDAVYSALLIGAARSGQPGRWGDR